MIDRIREIEAFAATNSIKQFGIGDYQAMLLNKKSGQIERPSNAVMSDRPSLGVVNG